MQGIGPGVSQTYSDAAARQAAFAKGFSDHMQETLAGHAADTSNFLTNIVGAPASQVADVAAKVAPPAAGDTLYGLRGYIPASTLNEEGAAYTAAARELPAVAESQGLGQLGKVQAAQRTTDQGFAAELAKLAATAPQLRNQLATQLATERYRNAQLGIARDRLGLAAQGQQFNQKATAARFNLESSRFAQQTLNQNRDYQLSLARLGIAQKGLQLKAAAQEYKLANGGFTPAQTARFQGLLQTGIDTLPPGTTYEQYVAKSVEHGIPLSMAIAKANTHWQPTERPAPGDLANVLGISQQAAAGDVGWNQTMRGYNQMTGFSPDLAKAAGLIGRGARSRGLDPKAVAAVSYMEGAGGGIGDQGTSFGPWQLHIGGALPRAVAARGAAYAQKWAWSPAGINYALDQMAKVAKGLTGDAAITAIVSRFERPQKPAAEISGAQAAYRG